MPKFPKFKSVQVDENKPKETPRDTVAKVKENDGSAALPKGGKAPIIGKGSKPGNLTKADRGTSRGRL